MWKAFHFEIPDLTSKTKPKERATTIDCILYHISIFFVYLLMLVFLNDE
jgi:hypothetical protein